MRDVTVASARPAIIGTATAIMAAFPVWQLTRNFAPNDHHRRTYEMRYLDALFASFEPRAAIVYEAYAYDQLILYKLIGERAAGERSIRMVAPDRAAVAQLAGEGTAIYAFEMSRRALEGRGAAFEPSSCAKATSRLARRSTWPRCRCFAWPRERMSGHRQCRLARRQRVSG